MRKAAALFVLASVLGVANIATAQTTVYNQGVYVMLSDPRPLSELNIPFTADVRFFANYSPNTAVVYVNKEEVGTIPPNMYVLATFYSRLGHEGRGLYFCRHQQGDEKSEDEQSGDEGLEKQ